MTKFTKSMAAVALLTAAGVALAGGPDQMSPAPYHKGFYAGVNLGYGAFSDKDMSAIKEAAKQTGFLKFDDSGVVFGAQVGYDINQYFAAQVQYMFLPKISLTVSGTNVSSSVYSNMFTLEAKGKYPIHFNGHTLEPFAVFGYGPVFNSDDGDNTDSTTEWEPVAGAGLEYKLNQQFGIYGQYRLVIDANNKFSNVNMGVAGVNVYF